jgi:hypothetical protein
VVLVAAMAEIEAEDIDAGFEQGPDHLGRRTGRAQCRDNTRAAKTSHSLTPFISMPTDDQELMTKAKQKPAQAGFCRGEQEYLRITRPQSAEQEPLGRLFKRN